MIPKIGTFSDVYAVDMLCTQVEDAMGVEKKIGFELIVETALGMQNINEIAAYPRRLESLHFGVADYAASTKAKTTVIGGPNPNYHVLTDIDGDNPREKHWGDMWHHAVSKMVIAARANGLRPIDGPFGDFNDPDGYIAQANRSATLGCEGKWAIHPSQIDLANKVMSHQKKRLTRLREFLRPWNKQKKMAKELFLLMVD